MATSRVDLSGVALWKRLTLIATWFMFGTAITIAFALQFRWVLGDASVLWLRTHCFAWKGEITVSLWTHNTIGWSWRFESGSNELRNYGGLDSRDILVRVLGLAVAKRIDTVFVVIHQFWLISVTFAQFCLVRWRIRRFAKAMCEPIGP